MALEPFEPVVNQQEQNPARKLSSWLDTLFRPVGRPLGAVLGGLGREATEIVSPQHASYAEQTFQHAGEHLPRLALEFAAVAQKRLPVKLAGLGDVLLRSSTEPGADIGTGLGQTAAFALAPKAVGLGAKAVEPLARQAQAKVSSPLGKLLAGGAIRRPAGIAAGSVPFEAANALEAFRRGRLSEYKEHFGSPEHIIETAAGTLPFEVARIPGDVRAIRSALVTKTPVTENQSVFRVRWEAHETPRFRDFGSEEQAKDFADEVRRTVGGEPLVENAGTLPRQRTVYNMAFKPEQLQGPFGLTGVDLLNEPAKSALKLATDKEGLLDSKSLVGRLKTVLPPAEFDIYEKAGLGNLLSSKKKVTPGEVQEWMAEKGPRVETRVIKSGQGGPQRLEHQELMRLQHELETAGIQFHGGVPVEVDFPRVQTENPALYARLQEHQRLLNQGAATFHRGFDPDIYRSIAPKDADQTVVMVRVPQTGTPRPTLMREGLASQTYGLRQERDRAVGILHRGGHFGNVEDINVLGWARVQYEDVGGKKAAHVIEVQSDWAQKLRELKEKDKNPSYNYLKAEQGRLQHPLLRDYNRLVLKSAIDQAIKDGAEKIVVSDAETAMMTEGHDLVQSGSRYELRNPETNSTKSFDYSGLSPEKAEVIKFEIHQLLTQGWKMTRMPEQETGMRMNYDPATLLWGPEVNGERQLIERFPTQEDAKAYARHNKFRVGTEKNEYIINRGNLHEIMEELTGEKGKRVSLGEHQKAFYEQPSLGNPSESRTPRSNLIFKNPDGTPKTDASGLEYDLSKVQAELSKQGGFPLFGKGQFIKSQVQRMDLEGYEPDQILRAAENLKTLKPLKGEDALQTLARSVGIDPRLFVRMEPGQSLERAFDFFASVFHHNFGETPERAAYFSKQVMTSLARFAPYMKQTAFAVSPHEEGSAHLFATPRPLTQLEQYLITIPDFSKHKKLSPESAVFMTALSTAHESAHNMIQEVLSPVGSASPDQVQTVTKALASVEAIPPMERKPVVENLVKLVVPKERWDEIPRVNMERYANEPEEFLADFAALISVGSLNPRSLRNMEDLMTFGDRASQNFSAAVYKDLASTWGMVRDWMRVSLGYKPGPQEKDILRRVNSVYESITKLMQARDKAEETFAAFNAYMDRTSTGPLEPPPIVSATQMHRLFERLDDLNAFASEALGKVVKPSQQDMALFDTALSYLRPQEAGERAAGERLTFWRSFFNPMVQLAESLKEKVPSAVPIKDLGFSYRGMVSDAQTAAWRLWQTTDAEKAANPLTAKTSGGIDWKRLRWLSKDGSPQERAFNKITLAHNVRQQEKGNNEVMSRKEMEEVSPEYKAMSDEDKARIDLSVEQAFAMTKLMAHRTWESHKDRVVWGMTKVLMSYNPRMFHDKAYEMAKEAVDLTFNQPGPTTDQLEQIAYAQKKVNFMESIPLPEHARQIFLKAIEENREPWLKLGDQLLGPVGPDGLRPGKNYMPEVRTREWHVNWKLALEDQPHHEAFNTEAEAVAKKKAIEKVHGERDLEYIKSFNRKDRTERFRGLVQEEISSVQQDALDALKKTILSSISMEHPEAQDIVRQINEELQPSTAFANIAVSPYMRKREFIPGRENLNMAEGLLRYVDAVSYQMAKRHVKQAGLAVLFNPDMRANPDVRNKFERYLRFVTDSEGKEFDLLRNLTFFNYIGLNPSTMMVEPTQQLVTLVPYLVENGMGVRDAYKMLRDVNKDLLKINLKHEGTLPNKWEARNLKELEDNRVIDTGFTADLYGEGDVDFAGQRSNILGNSAISEKVDLMKRGLYQMLAVGRKSYGWVTTANGRVAATSAFRYAWNRSKATTEEARYNEAHAFARQATDATMFGGGRANRPMVLQQWGKLSGIGGVMYTLGSYTLNTMGMMARLTRKAIQAQIKNPQEQSAALKAAGTMWATQFALGGILGLPLVAAGVAVLEQIFPGLDARKAMREGLVNLAGEDEDMGHFVADGSMRGLLNLSSVDFGSRFQLGNFLGVSPYDGFSWRNLAGPAATMLENWGKSVSQASEGRWGDAVRSAAPVSVKNVFNLVRDDWAVRDRAGRLIAELTPAEKTLAAIGFKPKKLTQFYEQQAILERSEDRKAREVRDVRTEVAKLIAAGDVAGARARIIEGIQEVGPYDPLDMAREAAQLAQEMTTPTPLRAGSRANLEEAAEIARLFPRTATQSEKQRVLRRALLMRQIGASSGRPNLRELRRAALVDQYLRQNPRANIAEARAAVERRMMGPGARRRRSLFEQAAALQ